jgi:hypothetical protein
VDELLRSISWHAEKLFRRHGTFASVLWQTEDAAGHRQLFETGCDRAPDEATDAQILAALAADMAADFAASGVTRFAVAYLARRVTVIRPIDRNATMQPTTTKRQGVVIELHDGDAGVRLFREIIRPSRGKPVLGAAVTIDEPITASPYFDLLRADADAEA